MALIREQIDNDIAASMKEGDTERTSALRLLKNSIQNEQIKMGHLLLDQEIQKVLQREAKQRRDSIDQFKKGGRDDLAVKEEQELNVIEHYLPEQLSDSELEKLVDDVIKEVKSQYDAPNAGVVIGAAMKKAAGQADGAAVSALVRQKLA